MTSSRICRALPRTSPSRGSEGLNIHRGSNDSAGEARPGGLNSWVRHRSPGRALSNWGPCYSSPATPKTAKHLSEVGRVGSVCVRCPSPPRVTDLSVSHGSVGFIHLKEAEYAHKGQNIQRPKAWPRLRPALSGNT